MRVLREHDGECQGGTCRERWRNRIIVKEPTALCRVLESIECCKNISRISEEYDESIGGI